MILNRIAQIAAEFNLPWILQICYMLGGSASEVSIQAALENGNLGAVRCLVGLGVDFRAHNDRWLRMAAAFGHIEIVKHFIGAGADVHARGDECVRVAGQRGDFEMVRALVDRGADFRACNYECLRGAIYWENWKS